jgi:hypothetical protein
MFIGWDNWSCDRHRFLEWIGVYFALGLNCDERVIQALREPERSVSEDFILKEALNECAAICQEPAWEQTEPTKWIRTYIGWKEFDCVSLIRGHIIIQWRDRDEAQYRLTAGLSYLRLVGTDGYYREVSLGFWGMCFGFRSIMNDLRNLLEGVTIHGWARGQFVCDLKIMNRY